MSEGAAALRGAAARWSLAGDQQLLDLLQEIHQRIISKCNETNQRLEEMSRGLRDASVNLQNVNNKFLALSNTQFVESRVYEDDADVAPPAGGEKESPKAVDLSSELTKLKRSLQILESYHEPLLIVGDSDESDSDHSDDRLVLKPKDLYADRPLPYIIGSQPWRSKWHAGLVPDDSDSDSSTSKAEEPEVYSDSEDEQRPEDTHYVPARKISSDSSSLQSDAPLSVSPVRPSPSAVAAELARRLGGDIKIPEREPVYNQPEPVVRKLYKPQEPIPTTIFPDEPPPLDDAPSDDDIFAELHNNQPKAHSNRVEDLFDFSKPSGLEEALFGPPKVQTNQGIDRPPLYADEPQVAETARPDKQPDDTVKKPVGGISLFGTNKHAESIGAAILKRNRRKSSTSGDESNTEEVQAVKEAKPAKEVKEVKPVKEVTVKEVKEVKERDIFDDLFAKSEKLNKKNAKTEVQPRDVVQPKEAKKKDVFSDIFDDIDDIFSSDIVNVNTKETKKNEALFSDDDDLFADIPKVNKKDNVASSEKSDLSDVVPKVEQVQTKEKDLLNKVTQKAEKREVKKENKIIKDVKETKGLFDSDSDDGLFTNVKDVKQNVTKTEEPVEYKLKDDLFDDDDDDGLFAKNTVPKPKAAATKNIKDTGVGKTALFDSDEELFKATKTVKEVKPLDSNLNNNTALNMKHDQFFTKPVNTIEVEIEKPDIIKEIESEESIEGTEVKNSRINSINNDLFTEVPEYPKESLETSRDSFDDDKNTKMTSKTDAKDITTAAVKSDKESQNNEINSPFDDDIFGDANKQTYFKENLLRTTRIGAEEETTPPREDKKETRDILNDSDDDLFKTPKIPTANGSQEAEASKPPETPDLFAANKNDFSDIFADVPPIFEKLKEPKKSKNVNALFDDDSDDEALFFKKSDVITDEKPTFTPSEERFGIFNDEPPAIDVDFTQNNKEKQSSRKTDNIVPTLDKTDDFKSISLDDASKSDKDNAEISREIDTTDNKEPKKIGKLKPMNFNINVNTLLPGASPKKKQIDNTEYAASNEELHKTDKIESKMVKSISFDDPEILDNKISKERAKIQVKRRPSTRRARKEAVRKSAIDFTDSSFDSSNDNSTKEEVKKVVKTVYILNDDDIFGTTETKTTEHNKKHLNIVDSDDELFKTKASDTKETERNSSVDSNSDDLFNRPSSPIDDVKDEIDASEHIGVQNVKTGLDNKNYFKINEETEQESYSKDIKVTETKSFLDSGDDDLFKQTHKTAAVEKNYPNIDSDEELFRNPRKNKINDEKAKIKSFLSSDDDDDLFKTKSKEIIKPTLKSNSSDQDILKKGIDTLGKVYNNIEDAKAKETHSIFDDFPAKSNEILESQNKTTAKEKVDTTVKEVKAVKKSILDDLSDEEDLFKSKTKLLSRNNRSLFGDDDDGDDLFGSKPVKETKQEIPAPLPTKEPKAAEPVFVDPLSLFGDEE